MHEALLELDGHAPPPLPPANDKSLRAARRLLTLGRRAQALTLIDKAISENPDVRITSELVPDPYAEARQLYAALLRGRCESYERDDKKRESDPA